MFSIGFKIASVIGRIRSAGGSGGASDALLLEDNASGLLLESGSYLLLE